MACPVIIIFDTRPTGNGSDRRSAGIRLQFVSSYFGPIRFHTYPRDRHGATREMILRVLEEVLSGPSGLTCTSSTLPLKREGTGCYWAKCRGRISCHLTLLLPRKYPSWLMQCGGCIRLIRLPAHSTTKRNIASSEHVLGWKPVLDVDESMPYAVSVTRGRTPSTLNAVKRDWLSLTDDEV